MRRNANTTGVPDHEIAFLARAILKDVLELYEREDIKEEFEIWKKNRRKEKLNIHNKWFNHFVIIGQTAKKKQSRKRTFKTVKDNTPPQVKGGVLHFGV